MAKNKRQLKKQEKKAAAEALDAVVSSGTVTEMMYTKVMEAQTKPAKEDSKSETNISKMYESTISSLSSINESIKSVAAVFQNLTGVLSEKIVDRLEERKLLEYQQEEAQMEAVPIKKAKPTAMGEKEEKSTGSIIKDFFTNPAVVAAFSGLVYLFLPKEIKEKISSFFTGFKEGLGEVSTEFDTFKTALMIAGGGLATYLGVSVLKSVTEGIASTIALIVRAKKTFGMLGRGAQKVLGNKAGMAAVAIGGGAAVGAMATDVSEKEQKEKVAPESKPPVAGPTPSQPSQSQPAPVAESKPMLGGGITPQAKGITGLKVPEGTVKEAIDQASDKVGVDKSIMYAVAKQESGFNPNAKAGTSSATGLFQFITGTWNNMVAKFGKAYPELNKGPTDPLASATAGALYIKENSEFLKKRNIPVNGTTIYASHFLGPGGAAKLLTADPTATAAQILPEAANANKSILFNKDGTPATVQDVINFLYKKVGAVAEQYAAMGQGITPPAQMALAPAAPVPSAPSTGTNIAMASESMEDTARGGGGGIINNSIDNSRRIQEKTGLKPPPPIPSPVASRGVLDMGIKHNTAYAT